MSPDWTLPNTVLFIEVENIGGETGIEKINSILDILDVRCLLDILTALSGEKLSTWGSRAEEMCPS